MTNEQLYPLPDDWHWCRLGDFADIIGGGTPSSKNQLYYENGQIPWITPADLSGYQGAYISHGARNITELGLKKSSAKLCPANTVCLTTRAPIGYVVIAENQLSTNQGFKNILPSEKYLPKYLYWYLKANTELLKNHASGTTFLELSKRRLSQIPVPLPPLDEQQRIVELIDELFAKLDAAKSLAQKVVDGSELRRASILHKAFTGELTEIWRDEHGTTLDSWQKKFLSEVLTTSKQKTDDFSSNLKYVGLENLGKNGGQISFQSADAVKSTKSIFHAGDLLYGKLRPYLDKHAIAQFDGVCSTDILVFNANDQSLNEFINYFFWLPSFIEYAVANSKGINLPRISEKTLLLAEILLPPLDEQKEIVRILDDLLGRERRTTELAGKTLERVEIMKKLILSQAFRGELN